MSSHTWNPLDEDYFTQEMERDALDALYEEEFSVVAQCRSCLLTIEVDEDHLCARCADMDQSLDGALVALLNSN